MIESRMIQHDARQRCPALIVLKEDNNMHSQANKGQSCLTHDINKYETSPRKMVDTSL